MSIETISGTVERVFFCNADSPFSAGVLQSGERFSGACIATVGDNIKLTGSWTNDPKYGLQFKVEGGTVEIDESPAGMVSLLSGHADFEGVGPARARKIVEAAQALDTTKTVGANLTERTEEVAAASGVSLAIVAKVAATLAKRTSFFASLAALCEMGWSSAQASRITNVMGDNAPALVGGDPYMLIGKIPRFGFRTVDAVARKMGVTSTDPMRLAAGVAFCLDRIGEQGNTWTTKEELFDAAIEELQPDTLDGEDKTRAAMAQMIETGLIREMQSPTGIEIVADARVAAIEFEVFRILIDGLTAEPAERVSFEGPRSKAIIDTLNQGQAKAMRGFSARRFGVISGGAGVGKTYMTRSICDLAEENGMAVELCAPTGKAARKLSHATNRQARTIHRLLEPCFDAVTGGFAFGRNASNKLDADLVVMDECSMTDIRLMRSLLLALKPSARLLLVGDHHQIPSVGAGAILRDLLSAQSNYPDAVNVLTEIVRQAGTLARNTTSILDGVVVPDPCPAWGIERTERGNEKTTAGVAASFVEAMVTSPEPLEPFGRHLDPAWDVQVLSPMRKGPLGTWALNVKLQELRQRMLGNPRPAPTPEGKAPKPLVGDRVIWTKNDYELDLFNGTQALVREIKKGGALLIQTEDGREVMIPSAKRVNIEVAYAMTIHKSQGSEWPLVVLAIASSHWIMRDRNLLYTGASRASESLAIIGDIDGIRGFAREKRSAARQTLGAFLVAGWSADEVLPFE